MAEMILRLHIESKSFSTDRGELPVLGRIEIALGAREIVALVGPSGCGKTTLLRIVGDLDTDFQGTLDWCGAAMPRIGTVFQEPRLLPWRTVRQNLLLAQRTEDPELADALLHSLDLAPFRDAFPSTLSLGMARRVAIARAFAIDAGTHSAGRTVRLARPGDGRAQPGAAAERLAGAPDGGATGDA